MYNKIYIMVIKKSDEFSSIFENQIKKERKIIESLIPNNISIKSKNESQKKLINSIKNNEITICSGQAGSGKTYIAVGCALKIIRKISSDFRKIYLIKSVIPLRGEEIGFLKGDYMEKIEPYMQSFYLNIEKFINKNILKRLINEEIIKPFPVAFLRGTSIDNAILIIDESQNLSMDNMETIMTRLSNTSKMIILGDTNQIDLKNKNESSLKKLTNLFNEKIDGINVVEMDKNDDNVRNPLIKYIEEIFREFKNKKNGK